ncbi:hypothetical protein IKG20_00215 [Candidatus Saccharibacteria bacterium]|nr:hypothetical protein [Candidatus Saccharibacteria bacterium]
MFNDAFGDFIPAQYDGDLELENRRDVIFLGRENLTFLKDFWESRARKFDSTLDSIRDYRKFEARKAEIERCQFKASELERFIKEAESKPRIFEKTAFRVGSKVVCFQEKPDCYVSGEVSEIYMDPETRSLNIIIRVSGNANFDIIRNRPDGFTLFTAEDFEYFKRHIRFFEIYLRYYTQTVTERDKVSRMLKTIVRLSRPEPTDIA